VLKNLRSKVVLIISVCDLEELGELHIIRFSPIGTSVMLLWTSEGTPVMWCVHPVGMVQFKLPVAWQVKSQVCGLGEENI